MLSQSCVKGNPMHLDSDSILRYTIDEHSTLAIF